MISGRDHLLEEVAKGANPGKPLDSPDEVLLYAPGPTFGYESVFISRSTRDKNCVVMIQQSDDNQRGGRIDTNNYA
jgi:hypothetical protein